MRGGFGAGKGEEGTRRLLLPVMRDGRGVAFEYDLEGFEGLGGTRTT